MAQQTLTFIMEVQHLGSSNCTLNDNHYDHFVSYPLEGRNPDPLPTTNNTTFLKLLWICEDSPKSSCFSHRSAQISVRQTRADHKPLLLTDHHHHMWAISLWHCSVTFLKGSQISQNMHWRSITGNSDISNSQNNNTPQTLTILLKLQPSRTHLNHTEDLQQAKNRTRAFNHQFRNLHPLSS